MIEDLNSLPEHVIEQARRLPAGDRHGFLWRLVKPRGRLFLELFIEDVVDGGAEARTWGRGKILVANWSLSELLERTVSEVVESLGEPAEGGWFSVDLKLFQGSSEPSTGAPAVLRRGMKYSCSPPEGATAMLLDEVPVRAVRSIDIAVRRWMAYRVSAIVGPRLQGLAEVSDVVRALDLSDDAISPDAEHAIRALLAEAALETAPGRPAGFRGPDRLYR
jgi:hypothetical protein